MLYNYEGLKDRYPGVRDIRGKAMRERRAGNLYRLKEGLFSDEVINAIEAGMILEPYSYLSFGTVLMLHDLVPEFSFNTYAFATLSLPMTRRWKVIESDFGDFVYRPVPPKAFYVGLIPHDGHYGRYYVATKEKSLMDLIYRKPGIETMKDMEDLLLEDLRMEYEDLLTFDINLVKKIADAYQRKRDHLLFLALLKGWKGGKLPNEHIVY